MSLSEKFAIAFDLGTTTIAASLISLESGRRLAMTGGLNPQRVYGTDVVSRLEAALKSPTNQQKLAGLINGALAELAEDLVRTAGADMADLIGIGIAGNPAMEHLLLGLPVESLAFPPYRPLFTAAQGMATRDLGWDMMLPVFLFPLPGGFVGGDLVAFLYGLEAASPLTPPSPSLFLDLGTNGELALRAGDRIYATSAAAGPAFEGGNLSCGMAALPGAISRVRLEGDRVVLETIDGKSPVGICGSGVIDTVTLLLTAGVLDPAGRLLPPDEISSSLGSRVQEVDGALVFVLYRDAREMVFLSQEDIRQVQLAKGAIRAGMEVLFERSGVSADDLREVVLTGSFGAVLSPRSLKNVGIFTEKMVELTRFVPEGALAGVEMALCSPRGLEAVDLLAQSVKVVPLSGTPAFEKHFLEHLNFPKTAQE